MARSSSAVVRQTSRGRTFQLIAAALAWAVLAIVPRSAVAADPVGTVEDLTGEAFVRESGTTRALEKAGPVHLGDHLGTGRKSRLGLLLGKQTRLRMGERTQVTIDRFVVDAGGEITVRAGPVLFDRPKATKRRRLSIRTPFGVIAVRGTRFFVGPVGNRYGVFVERGSVAVSAGRRTVVVREGQGTDLNPGRPPTPPRRWGRARINLALDSVR